MMDGDTKASITRAGIAAPSADNSQPWRFVWHQDALDLHIDAKRSGGVSDTRYVLSDLAAGACMENLIIQARALGYAAEPDIFPQPDAPLWAARICWRRDPENIDAEPLTAAITRRHTHRGFPWRGPIDDATRSRLNAQAATIAGAQLWWPSTAHEAQAARHLIQEAEALRFKSPTLHAELFSSIRFDAGWHAECEEGLAPGALAVEAPLRPVFAAMRRPRVMNLLKHVGAAPMLGWRSAGLPTRLSPGLCLVTVSGTDRADVLAAGRALERVWLQATLEGLAVQPYAAAGVLGLGFVPVEPKFQQALADLRSALDDLGAPGHGLVFLRLGHARSAAPGRSGRRQPASFGDTPAD